MSEHVFGENSVVLGVPQNKRLLTSRNRSRTVEQVLET